MDIAELTPAVPATPEPVPAPQSPPEEATSIADHAAQFSVDAQAAPPVEREQSEADRARDEQGRFTRHRAQSQRATVEDVSEINTLTKTLREKERELLKIRPDAIAGSPRLVKLKREIKAIEAELADAQPKPAEPVPTPAPVAARPVSAPAPVRPSAPGAVFPEAPPTAEQFAHEDDPYKAQLFAEWKYAQRKEAWEQAQAEASAHADAAAKARHEQYQTRLAAFAKTKPDFQTVTAKLVQQKLPVLLLHALTTDDNGPAYVYHLAQHPDLVDELFLFTAHKPIDEDSVAIVQRRLKQHAQAAPTRSAAVAPASYLPPTPPNLVRTGPVRNADDPPGEASSVAEHARHYGQKRR